MCVFMCVLHEQGIPSSPVQESNPPAQAPASGPTEAPSLAEGNFAGFSLVFSCKTCNHCELQSINLCEPSVPKVYMNCC